LIHSSSRAAAFIVALCGAGVSHAGTIRHDRLDQAYRDRAALPQFAPVGSYTGSVFGSFTVIAPNWAITAAHVVDSDLDGLISDESITNDTLRIGAQSRTATQAIIPVGINGNRGWNGNINDGFDIALVHFATPFTGITPASIYTSFQELGQSITSVGFGATGTGKTGAFQSAGTKRAGDNVVDRYVTFSNGATALRWDFDEPAPRVSPNQSGSTTPLDLEYLIAGGDSGGGSFIFENDVWSLAGVHSGTYPSYVYAGATDQDSTYGDEALITRVAAYQQFILTHIPDVVLAVPEPSGVAVLVLSCVMMTRRRRDQR
jgi:hypothetical protein